MQQYDGALREFGFPVVKVVLHGIVGMEAIDVQQVHRSIGKLGDGLIEGSA